MRKDLNPFKYKSRQSIIEPESNRMQAPADQNNANLLQKYAQYALEVRSYPNLPSPSNKTIFRLARFNNHVSIELSRFSGLIMSFQCSPFLEETLYHGREVYFMVKYLETGVEVKKVDAQGRIILPTDWREAEIGESRELYVIKRKGYLKIVPKRRVDLTENFDSVDLGVEAIGNWKQFEKKFYEASA